MASGSQHPLFVGAAIAGILALPIAIYGIYQAHVDTTSTSGSNSPAVSQSLAESPNSALSTPPTRRTSATASMTVHVETTADTNAGDDVVVGKNLYQISSNGAVFIYYSWQLRNADDTASSAALCQMLVSLKGPEDHAAFRSGDCVHENGNYVSEPDNLYQVETPGTYALTVTDELHHAVGHASFKVLAYSSSR